MTKQNCENFGSASYSVDALALALQTLELSILQSNDALNNRMKLLETKFDGFQSFLTNAVMTTSNNVAQLLLQSYQQRAVSECQMIAQRNAPADIEQLLQTNALRSLQSMVPQQQAAVSSQQSPVLPTDAQVPLFSQSPPPTAPPPAVFPTPQSPVPTMQPPEVSQPLFPNAQPSTTPIVQPSAVVSQVSKPAAVAILPTFGFGDKFIKKEGEWDCAACYLRNKSGANQCVACQSSRDGKKTETVKDVFKPAVSASTSLQLNKDENVVDAENATDDFTEVFVPNAHYEPVVFLPPEAEVQTGEEDEQKLFDVYGKLYISTSDGIKERGIGNIKILRNSKNYKHRVIMRRHQVLKICLNAPIVQGMAVNDKPNKDNVGLFAAKDFSDGEYPDGKAAVFLVKFENSTYYQEFKKIFNECAGQMKAAASPVKDEAKPSASKRASFLDKSKSENVGDAENATDDFTEVFVPNAHCERVVPLQRKVEVQTGEEDEQKLFDVYGKLYINTTDGIKRRGIGNIRILRNSKNYKHRVVLRCCFNAPIIQGMAVNDEPKRDNVGFFAATDFSDGEFPDGKSDKFYVKFENSAYYQEFKRIFNECAEK